MGVVGTVLKTPLYLIYFILCLVTNVVQVALFFPVVLFRTIAELLTCYYCKEGTVMRSEDAIWIQEDPKNLMIIQAILAFDAMDLETIREKVKSSLIEGHPKGANPFQRFLQLVKANPNGYHWLDDPAFDIANHVFNAPAYLNGASQEEVEAYISKKQAVPMSLDKPLWEFELIENFEYQTNENGKLVTKNGSGLIFRVHHVIADGIALVSNLLMSVMSFDPHKRVHDTHRVSPQAIPKTNKFHFALAAFMSAFEVQRKLMWLPDRNPLHKPLTGKKAMRYSKPIPLDLLKAIKNAHNVTINDLITACYARGVAKAMKQKGAGHVKSARWIIPVNFRVPPEPIPPLQNDFVVLIPEFRLDQTGDTLLKSIHEEYGKLKESLEALCTWVAMKTTLFALPPTAAKVFLNLLAHKATIVFSNVPGPQDPVYWEGSQMKGVCFWPPSRGSVGLTMSAISYGGEMRFGVYSDLANLQEPGVILDGFFEALEEYQQVVAETRL